MGEIKSITFQFNISIFTSFWRSPPPVKVNINQRTNNNNNSNNNNNNNNKTWVK